jgi:hypothetical protein
MPRAGLTNFAIWALASAVLSYLFLEREAVSGLAALLIAGALLVAWRTRYWPEALGALSGFAATTVLTGLAPFDGQESFLIVGVVAGLSALAMWRHLLARGAADPLAVPPPPPPPAPPAQAPPPPAPSPSTPARLSAATILGSFVLLVVGGVLALVFGFSCGSDTTQVTPGTDKAAWCDLHRGDRGLLLLFGPPLIALVLGLVAARRQEARRVLLAVVAGFALTVAVHVPDWVLAG